MASTDAEQRIDLLSAAPPEPESPPSQPPADEPGSIGERLRRPQTIISFALAIGILAFFFRRLDIDFAEVWTIVSGANPWLYGLAFVIYYLGMYARGVRWRWMLEAAEVGTRDGTLPSDRKLTEILLLSWFVNCVVPARLGDAYRSWLLKRETGASFSASFGTILAERLVDLLVLVGMMAGAGILTFHGRMPGEARQTFIAAGALVLLGVVGLVALWMTRSHVERRLPQRWQGQFARLHDALFACLRRPGRFILMSIGIWISDGVRLLIVAAALGADLPLSTAVFVALMSSMLTTLPITPAGLGVVEAAMIVVLKLVDIPASMATSIALTDRIITYWSLIVIGLILYAIRMRAGMKDRR
jgi:glycosyltransferase 2 family protein